MKNRNAASKQKVLSPEAYIQKRSRSLEIYQCYVNSDWEHTQMANVWVARKHTNGNITTAFYLVDLLCLGVKDTFYRFNMTIVDFQATIEKYLNQMSFDRIPYELAHNIIYAGYEYALEYGINPHRDFSKTTIFHLEEDNDDIEVIDIECGMDGMPHLMVDAGQIVRANEVIAILNKTAGEGNFHYTIGPDYGNMDE
ncbi:MAG: hypothetical protein K9H64_02940 [Bacteroidales bacterium]|nr:hypothetical protein [Bacteroidales bacterium]MCF8454502.1 hypothetical protein [Bacteroidales bacterium]